jgi:hypothetical protein
MEWAVGEKVIEELAVEKNDQATIQLVEPIRGLMYVPAATGEEMMPDP